MTIYVVQRQSTRAIVCKNSKILGSGCGSVGRAVTSDTRGPRFESSHRQKFIYILNNCLLSTVYWKDENKGKEAGNGPFKKNNSNNSVSWTKYHKCTCNKEWICCHLIAPPIYCLGLFTSCCIWKAICWRSVLCWLRWRSKCNSKSHWRSGL